MADGFYLMHRGWQDHAVFRNEAFSRRDAFVWLIEQAAWRPTRVFAGTGEITLERGQLSHSLRFMAKAWKWDLAKVSRFITSMINSKIIDTATDTGQTVITICNYEKYQGFEDRPDTPTETDAIQPRDSGDTKKNKETREQDISEAKASSISRASREDPFPCPHGVEPEVWRDFRANRKAKHLKDTPTAHAGVLRDLAKIADDEWPPGRLVRLAAEKGWGGIYDPRKSGNDNGSRNWNGSGQRDLPIDGFRTALREAGGRPAR